MESELSTRPSRRDKYTVIIPAAGMGRRMKIYGPKPLIQINKKHTILSNQIELIRSIFKYVDIILVTGFEHNKIVDSLNTNIKVVRNERYESTNVLHSIGIGLEKAKTDKVLVVYGDLIFNKVCINLPFNNESGIVICNTMKNEEVGCISNNNQLENIFYKLPNKWAQIAFFTGTELEILKDIALKSNKETWFGFEAINYILDNGGNFQTFTPKNAKALDIDSSYDIKLIKKL